MKENFFLVYLHKIKKKNNLIERHVYLAIVILWAIIEIHLHALIL
jgi:hypothetical protein